MRETRIKSSKIILNEIQINLQDTINNIIGSGGDPVIIKNISNYIELVDTAGDERGGLSAGQAVSCTYAFMSEVAKGSKVKTPFVVDSPTGPLDPQKRSSVGNFLPKFSEQVITFVQAAERRDFVSHVRKAAEYKCSHVTMTEDIKRHQKWIEDLKNADGFKETDIIITEPFKSLIVYGEKAFDSYDPPREATDARNKSI